MMSALSIQSVIRVLDGCEVLRGKYAKIFSCSIAKSNQEYDPPAIILKRVFEFGRLTLAGMRVLLESAEREGNAILACTLVRPYYEAATRVLWASRAPYGWDRLITYHAKEDLKWAKEAQRFPGTSELAGRKIEEASKLLDRKDDAGRPFDPAPPLPQLLKESAEQNVREGLTMTDPNDSSGYEYSNLYRWLCRPAHGHVCALAIPSGYLRHTGASAIGATCMLLQAYYHACAPDPVSEITKIGHEIHKVYEELVTVERT